MVFLFCDWSWNKASSSSNCVLSAVIELYHLLYSCAICDWNPSRSKSELTFVLLKSNCFSHIDKVSSICLFFINRSVNYNYNSHFVWALSCFYNTLSQLTVAHLVFTTFSNTFLKSLSSDTNIFLGWRVW